MSLQFTPYLIFNGQCREAFEFYRSVFGGRIEAMMGFRDTPMAGHAPPGAEDDIMHACLIIDGQSADGHTLMGSDSCGQPYVKPQGQHISIQVDTPEDAERIYAALSDQGAIAMELQETFWAKRFAMFTDRFNIPWMINCPCELRKE
ncbi:VOC family protein [Luteimonas aquatica]|uniref:VOC family protein n=1 Tax=Luteimonas aquatica TaxID=450364 RepID=UPI001F59573F|nr:VOC family protein [Luteimonas aquatica]